jgi:hypothetical protein
MTILQHGESKLKELWKQSTSEEVQEPVRKRCEISNGFCREFSRFSHLFRMKQAKSGAQAGSLAYILQPRYIRDALHL